MWPTTQGSSTRTISQEWQPTCPGRSEEPMCQTCTQGPLGVVILRSPQGGLGSPPLPSSLFLHMECTRPQEETHPLGCLHIRHTQGPLCQASPCHPPGSSPREPTLDSPPCPMLGSRQCHLPGSSRCQATQDTRGPGPSPLLCRQPSLETEAPLQTPLVLTPCETPRSCGRP